jgi:hypothetical protein
MATTSLSNEHLHCIFVYCNWHDQGAVAIITQTEWLDITTTRSTSTSESYYDNADYNDNDNDNNNDNDNDNDNDNNNYYEKVFKFVDTMCGGNPLGCKGTWDCCGELEYIPQGEVLLFKNSVKTNFDREGGGWTFAHFKGALFTSKEHVADYRLPRVVREFLSHRDAPYPLSDDCTYHP